MRIKNNNLVPWQPSVKEQLCSVGQESLGKPSATGVPFPARPAFQVIKDGVGSWCNNPSDEGTELLGSLWLGDP